jgi:uncharacterized protein (TIGR02099 family)
MPPPRAFLRVSSAVFLALFRFVGTVAIVGFAMFAFGLLAIRFIVFPQIESHRDALADVLAKQLGQPVEIAVLSTGWDGWNPKLVVEGLRVLDRARAAPTPLLLLPKVELIVSWTSLPLMELTLKELVIDGPRLAIRRDRSGVLHLAGIEFDPALTTDEFTVSDWILRQREIVVRDALILWDDDMRNAPQLVLDRVQFRLQNRFGHHRFGLKGTPPAELAAPLDLRGDLEFASMKDWQHAQGSLFVRLDYADVAAWREWLPLPGEIVTGSGALRIWFKFGQQDVREIVADVELADVKARLAEDLPEIELAHLSGRVGTRKSEAQREVFTRGLAFTTLDGERLDPAQFTLTLREAAGNRPSSARIEFDRLQLAPLVAMAAHLPLPDRVRADLARFAPRGTLTHGRLQWEGPAAAPVTYSAAAQFAQLGLLAQDAFPGATGLTGGLEATSEGGELRLASLDATVDLPRILLVPVAFDTLRGVVKWEHRDGATTVRLEKLEIANADVAGDVTGTYRTLAVGPGEVDIVARASRGEARQIHRYLPRTIDEATRDWLRTSLLAGAAAETRFKLTGNLADFPFPNGKGGMLSLSTKAKAVTLDYADGWPPIVAIDADVRIEGTQLTVDGARGRVHSVEIGRTHVEINDLDADHPLLRVDGEATGPIAGFLRFVDESPVAARTGQATGALEATGGGRLALKIELPLGRPDEIRYTGGYTLSDAQLRVAGAPVLAKVNGSLAFSERDVRAHDVAAEILGGPATLSLAGAGEQTRLTGGGTLSLVALRREYGNPYLDRVSGTIDWSIDVDALAPGARGWVFQSSMKGAAVDLPAPLGKAAGDEMPLRIEGRDDAGPPGTDFVSASYGRVARFVAHRREEGASPTIDRALLSLGRAVERPDAGRADRAGMWIRAELPAFNADDWIALFPREQLSGSWRQDPGLAFTGAEFDVHQFDAMGARFTDLKGGVRETQRGFAFDLDGAQIAGTATWSAPEPSAPNGRIVARLARVAIPGRGSVPSWRSADGRASLGDARSDGEGANPWPEIDLAAQTLVSKDRDLGQLEFVARPRGAEWQIERLKLVNGSGRLDASGAWRVAGPQAQTQLDVALDVSESGAFLARYGYPEALQGAPAKIDGQLSWSGAPHEFDFATLAGTLRVHVGRGRFTKLEPGPGKLLGVLSLQALPRRVTLDYSDVFSEGFAFDEITGNVRIAGGVMSSTDLRLVGPSAKVDISGEADFAKETQRLDVRVQPALSSSVSAGAALLFLANPLIGAAVGAGSLFAQTLLQDPVEKMFRFEYTVTGSWSDPVVTKTVGGNAIVAPGALAPPTARATQ